MTRYVLHTDRPAPKRLDLEAALNEQQLQAVLCGGGPALVIAGAGSGKTRTLTYRAAHLLSQGLDPARLLLCTFTNRAAREMVRRVEDLVDVELKRLWAGTFHHVANLALRRYAERVGLPPNYGILDREDALDLMQSCLSDEGKRLEQIRFPQPRVLVNLLSRSVDEQMPLRKAVHQHATKFVHLCDEITRVVERFTARKLKLALVDYDDLLLFFKILLTEHPGPAEELTERFEHVLVDEYQDTSLLQGQIMDACAARHRNLTVVGDDAQSIYSFRGAYFKNIFEFPKRYPDAHVFKLERNYRSSPQILTLANAVIRRNRDQFPKELRPVRPEGMVPAFIPLLDVAQQAALVAQRVLQLSQEEDVPLGRMAVLYRNHAHSLELQVELGRRKIPFTVRSGLRFFEQAHIKDITAYLRLSHNAGDALAWQRVLRHWPGVGSRSAERLVALVSGEPKEDPEAPRRSAAVLLADEPVHRAMPRQAVPSLRALGALMASLERGTNIAEMIEQVLKVRYREYAQAQFANAKERLEDLEQLCRFTAQYDKLESFLEELALVAGIAAEGVKPGELPDEKLTLSTVHQAKGLEWRVVFVIGLSEGRFPQGFSVRTREEEEEERRLFYVAVTRAEEQLYLCYPQFEETKDGLRLLQRPSRFVAELSGKAPPYERWEIEERAPS